MDDMRLVSARPNFSVELKSARIAHLKFIEGYTNQEIADTVGCGLTHVEGELREIVRKSDEEMLPLLLERRLAWAYRIEHLWKKLKERADILEDHGTWLDTIKQMIALGVLSHKIDGTIHATGRNGKPWLQQDESSLSDQQIVEMARIHGLRIPEVSSKLLPQAGSPAANP